MQRIKNIIFDLGGVILNIDINLTQEAFVDLGIKDFSRYFHHGFATSFFKDYETGKIGDEEFIRDLKKLGNLSAPDSVIVKDWDAMLLDFPPKRIELLKTLGGRYLIFLFSNTNALHTKTFRKIYRDTFNGETLDELFEKAYYSQLLGMRKPDVASYRYIIDENDLQPAETLFIDDASVNIKGANEAGLKGYFLEPGKTILDMEWSF